MRRRDSRLAALLLPACDEGLPVPREPGFVCKRSRDGEAPQTCSERRAGCPQRTSGDGARATPASPNSWLIPSAPNGTGQDGRAVVITPCRMPASARPGRPWLDSRRAPDGTGQDGRAVVITPCRMSASARPGRPWLDSRRAPDGTGQDGRAVVITPCRMSASARPGRPWLDSRRAPDGTGQDGRAVVITVSRRASATASCATAGRGTRSAPIRR